VFLPSYTVRSSVPAVGHCQTSLQPYYTARHGDPIYTPVRPVVPAVHAHPPKLLSFVIGSSSAPNSQLQWGLTITTHSHTTTPAAITSSSYQHTSITVSSKLSQPPCTTHTSATTASRNAATMMVTLLPQLQLL
jgi:hypothetical protein